MHENIPAAAARLSDDALDARLRSLAGRERDATFEIVVHLSELYGRKRHLGEGPGTLYLYCRDVLHLSEDAAYNRAAAARAVRRFPVILDGLADGSLNVTTVKLLRKVLTPENHLAVLAEAKHRSNREVKVIVARLEPRPDVPSSVRKLPTPRTTVPSRVASSPDEDRKAPPPPTLLPPPPFRHPVIAPLTPERYRVEFTVRKETHDRLRRVQDLLRRSIPDGDPSAIFDRALILLEREAEKELTAATNRPRPARATAAGSRHIPAAVRRVVWRRDGGQCAFVGRSGRCTSRSFLELHHVKPFAAGGEATVENISLRCRAHNVYESELVFGRFDPSVVSESPEKYAVSGEIPPVPERERASSAHWRST